MSDFWTELQYVLVVLGFVLWFLSIVGAGCMSVIVVIFATRWWKLISLALAVYAIVAATLMRMYGG